MPRERSRSPRSRSRSPVRASKRRSRSRSGGGDDDDRVDDDCRVHIADLDEGVSKHEIEREFEKFGELREVWIARNPPCFAFVVFKRRQDADAAVTEMDQRMLGRNRIKVSLARPRKRGPGSFAPPRDSSLRCYQCGERGHFSRDCRNGSYRRRYERSRSKDRPRRRSRTPRSRSRDRSPRRDKKKSSRSSPVRNGH